MKICSNKNTSVSPTEPLPAVHAPQPSLPLEPSTYFEGPIPAAPLVKPAGALTLLSSFHLRAALASHSESPTWRKQTGSCFALSKKQLLGLVWLSGTQGGGGHLWDFFRDTATYCIHNRGGGRAQAVSLACITKAYSPEAQTPSPARLLLLFLPDLSSSPPWLPGKLGKSTRRLSILADSRNRVTEGVV